MAGAAPRARRKKRIGKRTSVSFHTKERVSSFGFSRRGEKVFAAAMLALPDLSAQLNARVDLDDAAVGFAVAALASPEVADGEKATFLMALADKGETAGEVAAMAR